MNNVLVIETEFEYEQKVRFKKDIAIGEHYETVIINKGDTGTITSFTVSEHFVDYYNVDLDKEDYVYEVRADDCHSLIEKILE
ncbi:hypothetical protein [Paenibacillus elgii]|uniref:hypothetical protein n=1 Tax=Paenibacillus elgii TaxID=189691 RepID=UPI000248D234|nr:hypothetical protein [Paenibacillus elgii]